MIVRQASQADNADLRRLAELDSSPLPDEPLVVVESAGAIRAAVSIEDGRSIADPFRPTAELAALAEMRATQLRRGRRRRLRTVARTPTRPPRAVRGTA